MAKIKTRKFSTVIMNDNSKLPLNKFNTFNGLVGGESGITSLM
jgi:hypothetical protein